MSALHKQILRSTSKRELLKDIIEFDQVIDYLISKDIITEKDYMKIWNGEGDKLDLLLEKLVTKNSNNIRECFNVFQSIYGKEFKELLETIRLGIVNQVHLEGGFPKINKYIVRHEEEIKIKSKLSNITWDKSLVIYGRVGEGKSYLVSECLKDDELLYECFNNKLFWINAGDCENGSNILQPLNRLLQMVSHRKKKIDDFDDLIGSLTKKFASKLYSKSLVILDNARSIEIIECFQKIRCKLLIITYFKTVKNAELVRIDSGFTLNETVDLFAQHLSTNVENLNNLFLDDIKEIHELCKGHPSTLALLGVILSCQRDHALASKQLWDYIKEKIDKGEMDDLGKVEEVDVIRRNFNEALRMCIDTIKVDLKDLYYQFAVFPKDANISSEVLEVFWCKNQQEVGTIMAHFENRSLISSFYNINKKVYIYVIHDLFLFYLKNETKNRKVDFHKKLVNSYFEKYEFTMLPDDNYILLFLGYHLKQAELIEQFENFLDLRFIEHKIRIVGVNNMEQDLKMYRDEIINKNMERKVKLENCLKFIRDNKNELRQLQKTDIIQLALPMLKNDAQTLMELNQKNFINKLYFTIKLSAGRLKSSQEIMMKETVECMAFCTDSNVSKILIGLTNGEIILYCSQTNREFERFHGHKSRVFDIKVAPDSSSFLSISNDRTVKLWQFFSQRSSLDAINDVPTSPKYYQNEYYHAFNTGKRNNFKEFTYNDDNSYLISANFSCKYPETRIICTGTNNGKVILWNAYNKEKLFVTTETGFPVGDIHFLNDNKILFTKQEKIQIFKYEKGELNYTESIHNCEDITKLLVPKNDVIIAVGMYCVMMYKLPENDTSRKVIYESRDEKITCAAVAANEYFAIGVKSKVFLYAVSSGFLVETLEHNKIVTSISMDVSKDDDNVTSMILINFDDNSLLQCNIMMEHYTEPRNKQGLATTYWKNNIPMLALVLNDNLIKIQHEFSTINEVAKKHRITFITFSLCGNNIIFSLENGKIIEYQYKKKDSINLMNLGNDVKYLNCFDLENSESDGNGNGNVVMRNGTIIAITCVDNKYLIHVCRNGNLNRYSWDFPILYTFPILPHRILLIDEFGGVVLVNVLKTGAESMSLIKFANAIRVVTSASFCPKNNLIAITYIDKQYKTNHLEITSLCNKSGTLELQIDFEVRCSTFSYLGNILVLGGKNGKLVVYDIKNNFKKKILCNNSGVAVRFLEFSKNRVAILVVVSGKEVAWYNLNSFEIDDDDGNSGLIDVDGSCFDEKFWIDKTSHEKIPYLLQIVVLYSDAVHFSVSKNFETFLVVDDESRIYVMKCLRNS